MHPADSPATREALITSAHTLAQAGLLASSAGNLSLRLADGAILLTPTGAQAHELSPTSLVRLEPDGRFTGTHAPTSEWRFHRDLHAARPDIGAIVHAHPPATVALACIPAPIPPFHYMVAAAGGKHIPVAPYATFGTQALSEGLVHTLSHLNACIMAHHGLCALGPTLRAATKLAIEVEALAEAYGRILAMGKAPALLSDEELDRVLQAFRSYGQAQAPV